MLRNHEINLIDLHRQLSQETQQIFQYLVSHPALVEKLNNDYKNNSVTKISRKEAERFLEQVEHMPASNCYSFIFMQNGNGIRTPYVIGDIIGKGGNGVIKNAYNLLTGEHIALKIDRGYSAKTEQERAFEFNCEKDVLIHYNQGFRDELIRKGHHNNTVFYLAEEFISGESLDNYMHKDLSDALTSTSRTSIKCVGIVKTVMEIMGISLINLCKLHHMDYVHRDIKPGNIMVIKNKDVLHEYDSEVQDIHLIDFGGTDKHSGELRSIALGTFAYLPPELKTNTALVAFTKNSDIYSLGKTFQELLDMIAPRNISKISLFFRNVSDYTILIANLRAFIGLMTAENPQQRIDVDAALSLFSKIWNDWTYTDDKKNIRPEISLNIVRQEFPNLAISQQPLIHLQVSA